MISHSVHIRDISLSHYERHGFKLNMDNDRILTTPNLCSQFKLCWTQWLSNCFSSFIEKLFYVFLWVHAFSIHWKSQRIVMSTKRRGYKRRVTIGDVIFIIYLFAELSFTNNGSQSTFDNWLQKYVTNYAKLLYDKAFKDQILIFFFSLIFLIFVFKFYDR